MCASDLALSGTFVFCMFFILCGALLFDMCTTEEVPDQCHKTASLYGLSIILIAIGAVPLSIVLVSEAWYYMECGIRPDDDDHEHP
nr:hypothetical protein [Sicyoidochytrium minutum DNA virus]